MSRVTSLPRYRTASGTGAIVKVGPGLGAETVVATNGRIFGLDYHYAYVYLCLFVCLFVGGWFCFVFI